MHLVLARCGGNKRRACDVLDISYHTLQALLAYNRARDARRTAAEPPAMATGVESAARARP